ncbi:MAG: hypothetical protein HS124_00755 [Anaerolineales bacterium]|nr:hypothetical protein [Anaerolineales bacterium]
MPSATHTAAPTSTITLTATATLTLTPSLSAYGVIDLNVGEKLQAEGIVIPEELKNPEYKLDLATEYKKTEWGNAYGIDIPTTVIPEKGIAYGKYHIKGIGATQEAWDEYAKQHIKYMWIHYREYGNEADRDITLEQYVELLKAGRGGFEIPQYNPKTGFFDLKATVNPIAGYVKVISDNKYKELPLKGSTEHSNLFYIDKNGMVWSIGNDFEAIIEQWMDPKAKAANKPYIIGPNLAYALVTGTARIGLNPNECLATNVGIAACIRDSAKVEKKYTDFSVGIVPLYTEWLKRYEDGDHSAKPPMWIDD